VLRRPRTGAGRGNEGARAGVSWTVEVDAELVPLDELSLRWVTAWDPGMTVSC